MGEMRMANFEGKMELSMASLKLAHVDGAFVAQEFHYMALTIFTSMIAACKYRVSCPCDHPLASS